MSIGMNRSRSELVASLSGEDVIGIVAYEKDAHFSTLTDYFDLMLLVVIESVDTGISLSHYIKDHCRIQEIRLSKNRLTMEMDKGTNHELLGWATKGEILLDKDAYLGKLRLEWDELTTEMQERMLLAEFSIFLRKYLQSKEYERTHLLLDAYRYLLEALYHWARLVIIESGAYPGISVWEQVKPINLGVYKLYEELTTSSESLLKRVQLVHLACEFSVVSKMEESCRALLKLLEKSGAIGIREIYEGLGLHDAEINLSLILDKLLGKELIEEVIVPAGEDKTLLTLKYKHKEHAGRRA
ncbi:nucleotidyltransferase-like protein [Gorillibacterium massiliense]|uniref:nucleotidyltransferase-like protein n=1 Tax=Gorillibacterium massiliense TaxID=1280390 RepID=UPI0004B51D7B|nr:nucleotidyltransferase-like protein [Gorillibacterium massiliense]